MQRRGDAGGVVEVADGDVDAVGNEIRTRRVAHEGADVVAVDVQLLDDGTADVARPPGSSWLGTVPPTRSCGRFPTTTAGSWADAC